MVIITIGHDLMAQALELFCRRCWLLSPAGSRERKCGTGLWCVAAAVLAREDDIDIGGCVLEVLLAQVGVGHLLLHGGGVAHVLLPPWRWWDIVII